MKGENPYCRHGIWALLCFVMLFSGCGGHSGVSMMRGPSPAVTLSSGDPMLPKGITAFQVNAGDVIRIEAKPKHADTNLFLLDKGAMVYIRFFYDPEMTDIPIVNGGYRIMPGDVLQVDFITDSGLSFETTVRLDGWITIPKIGELLAAGKTAADISRIITRKFRGVINDPRSVVTVVRTNMEPISAMEGEYIILPDGSIVVPSLGRFRAAGLSPEGLGNVLSYAAKKKYHNNFRASVVTRTFLSRRLELYDRVITVTPAGEVILPEVGSIHVAGMTLDVMKENIQHHLMMQYNNPVEVSLTLVSGVSNSVYVSGEVRFPGVYPMSPAMTTLKAVMQSGGITNEGDIDEVVLMHYETPGDLSVYKTNLSEVMENGRSFQDLALSPQDVVFVPKKGISNANLFIEQYITRMLPFTRSVNYNYNQNPDLNQN